eukprot:SAG22_NODE_3998_length_1431_cov_1.931682_1_plen_317_part_10
MDRLSKLAGHFGQSATGTLPATSAPHTTTTAPAAAAHQQHVLIVGGTGLIGRSCAEHFAALEGWRATTVARRPLPFSLPAASQHTHLELDLSDREACKAAVGGLPPVTTLVYAAMGTTAADADPSNGTAIDVGDEAGRALNSAMFNNLLDPLEGNGGGRGGGGQLHIQLMQGRLAYGGWAVHPSLFPSREDRPDKTPSWYFDQEDELRARLDRHDHWRVTLWRPPAMLGHAAGGHLNVVAALGAYAALRRARGETVLPRPAASAGFGMAFADQLCDVRLLSAAMGWAAQRRAAPAFEIFNIDNGDVVAWEALVTVVA